jgi:hypothetical protein
MIDLLPGLRTGHDWSDPEPPVRRPVFRGYAAMLAGAIMIGIALLAAALWLKGHHWIGSR